MSKRFKVRPVHGKVKDGPFHAVISDQHLAQFGGQNQTPAWITGKKPVQVVLWREVAQKGQSQASIGRVILLSETVRELAGLSLGDEVNIMPDEASPLDARSIVLSLHSASFKFSGDPSMPLDEAKEMLVKSSFVSYGQSIAIADHAWFISQINGCSNGGIYTVTEDTEIVLSPSVPEKSRIIREGIFGLGEMTRELERIWDDYREESSQPYLETSPGLTAILITGQPSTGKSLLLDAIARLEWPKVFRLRTNDPISEKTIRETFERANKMGRALIVADNAEQARDPRNQASGFAIDLVEAFQRYRHERNGKILFAAATRSVEQIDERLLDYGGFNSVYRLRLPDSEARHSILRYYMRPITGEVQDYSGVIEEVARLTPAFSAGDLIRVVEQMQIQRKLLPLPDQHSPNETWRLSAKAALGVVKPTTMRGIQVEVPTTRFADIGGQSELKAYLAKNVRDALSGKSSLKRWNKKPARGLLMYGPPGCSKTLFAKAIATEFGLNFLLVNAGELINSYVGESEKQIRELFRRARDASPCVIFFDEFEALGGERSSGLKGLNTTQTLLTEIDGVKALENVFILAATNVPAAVDTALLREGRLKPFLVGLPDDDGRREIIKIELSRLAEDCVGDVDFSSNTKATAGCTGAEVVEFVGCAVDAVSEEEGKAGGLLRLEQRHFELAKSNIRKSVDTRMLAQYRDWERQSRGSGDIDLASS